MAGREGGGIQSKLLPSWRTERQTEGSRTPMHPYSPAEETTWGPLARGLDANSRPLNPPTPPPLTGFVCYCDNAILHRF